MKQLAKEILIVVEELEKMAKKDIGFNNIVLVDADRSDNRYKNA